jgi:hypothetical protein
MYSQPIYTYDISTSSDQVYNSNSDEITQSDVSFGKKDVSLNSSSQLEDSYDSEAKEHFVQVEQVDKSDEKKSSNSSSLVASYDGEAANFFSKQLEEVKEVGETSRQQSNSSSLAESLDPEVAEHFQYGYEK